MWIQTGVPVRKRLSWVVTSVTLTFDLWPWPFAWTSLLSLVITPENFMMTGWWEHSQKGVTEGRTDGRTDGQTDGQTDWTIHRAAWSQLKKQGKSEGFDSCDRPSNLTQIGFKSSIFQPCDLEVWLMTSKNYRAPLLHYIKLYASSQTPRWIRTAVAVRKRSIRVKIDDFLPRVTLKFNGWPWKTIGIPLYVTLSFVHHFKAISEFKLKLQFGNAQFGPKWASFSPVWP